MSSIITVPTSSTATITNCNFYATATSTANWTNSTLTSADNVSYIVEQKKDNKLVPGSVHKLPDGSNLVVDFNGNYEIVDYKAKVTYKSNNIREFNKFVNSSDVLEAFIRDAGKAGVKQKEVFNLPIELFINWLIVRAAEKDGEAVDMLDFTNKVTQYLLPE